jgi:F-type H+-transporting ATPase subunit b
MRYGFRLNTDIFETNIVNLSVVIGVVVTVVGETVESTLTQRKQKIQLIFQTIDNDVDAARLDWVESNKILEIAHIRSETIRNRSIEIIIERDAQENEQLKGHLSLLRRKTRQSIQSDRQKKLEIAVREIIHLRITKTKHTLLETFETDRSRHIQHKRVNQILTRKNAGNIF